MAIRVFGHSLLYDNVITGEMLAEGMQTTVDVVFVFCFECCLILDFSGCL